MAANLGVLLGLHELLTNSWGIAGDLFAALGQPAPHLIRLVALVALPAVVVVTVVGLGGVLWGVGWRVVRMIDAKRQNDRWAHREFMACRQEIRYCLDRLTGGTVTYGSRIVDAGYRLRLRFLLDRLATLGVVVDPQDLTWSHDWVGRLDQLAVCAAFGDLVEARRLAMKWSTEFETSG
ncbi:MAG: hypothetical protein F4X98_19940 [Gammaproteobacteria bacterium]|nr:hypothetical protein [Gammaproteobacteria bacterium]